MADDSDPSDLELSVSGTPTRWAGEPEVGPEPGPNAGPESDQESELGSTDLEPRPTVEPNAESELNTEPKSKSDDQDSKSESGSKSEPDSSEGTLGLKIHTNNDSANYE